MKTITNILSGVMLFFCGMAPAGSADVIRIASYNIKFLTTGVVNQGNRLDKLKQVIQLVDADVYGFQEISNRAALELLFPQSDWDIRIDDSSGDAQDLAVAVRKARLKVKTDRFLFPSSADDNFFPNHRDLLCVDLQFPNSTTVFSVIVHHAKSRLDGRNTTDPRREGAAKKMVDLFKQDFQDKDFVLLGDFNDNPDDRSLNILELGDAGAFGAAEEMDGPFLINLMELLCKQGHVSHGLNSADVVGDLLNTVDANSRDRNNALRGTNERIDPILFDQILFPVWMKDKYVPGSAKVFDRAVGAAGNDFNRASDHLPVFADFVFDEADDDGPIPSGVRIVSLLANPTGDDDKKEEITIGNFTSSNLNLSGFKLRDKAKQLYKLSGTVPAHTKLTIIMVENTMPLNNSGDEVVLLDDHGTVVHKVSYTATEAGPGKVIHF